MLAHADARAVARAEIRAEVRVARQRQDTAGRRDAAIPDHDRAVMQRRLGIENILEQLRRHVRIDDGAAAHLLIERHAALKNDERTGLGRRQLRAGGNGLRNDIVHAQRLERLCAKARERLAAHALEQAAQLRLKDDDERDQAKLDRLLQDTVEHRQLQHTRQPQRDQDQQNALCKAIGIRLADEHDDIVNQISDDQDIHDVRKPDRGHQHRQLCPEGCKLCHKHFLGCSFPFCRCKTPIL